MKLNVNKKHISLLLILVLSLSNILCLEGDGLMPIQDFNTPYEIELNRDSNLNPITVIIQNEPHVIYDSQVLLAQLPSESAKVVISGKYEQTINAPLGNTNEFKVDYKNAIVYFHPDLEGTSVNISVYAGRGIKYLHASRVKLEDLDNLFNSIHVEGGMKELAQRINNLLSGVAQPSEVVDARLDGNSSTLYSTLKNRLDNEYGEVYNARTNSTSSVPIVYDSLKDRLDAEYDILLLNEADSLQKFAEVDASISTLETNKADKTETNALVLDKADKTYVDTLVSSLASGSPKGVYATVSALTSAIPAGDSNIYVVVADGKWYYWNGLGAWVAGGIYQSTGIAPNSVTYRETNFLELSSNLLNLTTVDYGQFLNTNGTISVNSTYDTSDFIPVSVGNYTISTCRRIAIYNSSKVFSSYTEVNPAIPKTITIAADGYIKVSFPIAYTNTSIVASGSVLPDYYAYGKYVTKDEFVLKNKSVTPKNTNFLKDSKNLFNPVTRSLGMQLTVSTGVLAANAGYDTSDYIPVKAGTYSISKCRMIVVYNSSKTYVVGYNVNPQAKTTITVAADGYIKATFALAEVATAMVEAGSTNTAFVPYGVYTLEDNVVIEGNSLTVELQAKINTANSLYGKTGLFLGDSICYGEASSGGYATILENNNNMININAGISGSTIAKRVGETDSILETAIASTATADYIILSGGVNDSNSGQVPLGTLSEGYTAELDEYTFYGAMESLLKTSILKWTGKKIGFLMCHNMNTRPLLEQYYEAVEICCKKWSIPYLDLFHMSGMNTNIEEIRNLYTLDTGGGIGNGTHPNLNGYTIYYVPKIEAWMKSL